MEECYICYNNVKLDDNKWKILQCNHKMCKKCFDYLDNNIKKNTCPFCRQPYKKTDITNNQLQLRINIEVEVEFEFEFNSRLERNRQRRRRRNLTSEEIKSRRKDIKKRCHKKWRNKDARLRKLKWYNF